MKNIIFITILLLIVGCRKEIPESITVADYYINNKTGNSLPIKAKNGNNPILLTDSIRGTAIKA